MSFIRLFFVSNSLDTAKDVSKYLLVNFFVQVIIELFFKDDLLNIIFSIITLDIFRYFQGVAHSLIGFALGMIVLFNIIYSLILLVKFGYMERRSGTYLNENSVKKLIESIESQKLLFLCTVLIGLFFLFISFILNLAGGRYFTAIGHFSVDPAGFFYALFFISMITMIIGSLVNFTGILKKINSLSAK